MIDTALTILNKIRGHHRILQYGTVALNVFDDRSFKEKFFDKVEDKLKEIKRAKKYRRTQCWHSYLDIATGKVIGSMAEFKEIEKKNGWVCLTPREIHNEAVKNQKYNEQKHYRETRKAMGEAIQNINNGYSYVKNMNDRIRKGQYEVGKREAMNG